jgi:hypothetical protein
VAIAFDNTGSATANFPVTALTVDITAASTGAFCYCYIQASNNNPSGFTMAGWQQLCDINEGTNSHLGLYRRVKQSGDTTFTVTWTNTSSATACWSSYTGLNATYPEEGFRSALHTAASATYTTASVTPASNDRWALCGVSAKSTVSAETWAPPGTQTIRSQAVGTTTPWSPAAIADSNGPVTQAQHNYAFTLSASESHGGAAICFLIPATSSTPAYPGPVVKDQGVQRAATW